MPDRRTKRKHALRSRTTITETQTPNTQTHVMSWNESSAASELQIENINQSDLTTAPSDAATFDQTQEDFLDSYDAGQELKRLGSCLKVENSDYESICDFYDIDFKKELKHGLAASGFEKPSAIQSLCLRPAVEGKRDILAQAHSGTGKTLAFALTVLQNIDETVQFIQGIILCPSKELVRQIGEVFRNVSSKMTVRVGCFTGGVDSRLDLQEWEKCQVAVATPGRMTWLVSTRSNRLKLKIFVIDEVDKLFTNNFIPQVHQVYKFVPPTAQIFLCSATMTAEVEDLANDILRNPVRISVQKEDVNLRGISQYKIHCDKSHKFEAILQLLGTIDINLMVIFVNSRLMSQNLSEFLGNNGHPNVATHGELTTQQRYSNLDTFSQSLKRILIATDSLCRGINVQGVTLVVNFEIPFNFEDYVHRIGRAGRFGRRGVAINFVSPEEQTTMESIEQYFNLTIQDCPPNIGEVMRSM